MKYVTSDEVWKPIPGTANRYEASSLGRIRSTDFFDGRRKVTGRILKPAKQKSGHLQIMLGRGDNRSVHRCVMEAFVGHRPLLADILHLDHNPENNAISNLTYGSRSDNLRMDYEVGKRVVPTAWKYSQNGQRKKPLQEYTCTM